MDYTGNLVLNASRTPSADQLSCFEFGFVRREEKSAIEKGLKQPEIYLVYDPSNKLINQKRPNHFLDLKLPSKLILTSIIAISTLSL